MINRLGIYLLRTKAALFWNCLWKVFYDLLAQTEVTRLCLSNFYLNINEQVGILDEGHFVVGKLPYSGN